MSNSKPQISLVKRILPIGVLGFLVSAYLLHHHLELKYGYVVGQSLCNINQYFDCDSVAKSNFSEFFGIPIALLGMIFYAVFSLALYFFGSENIKSRNLLFTLSLFGLIPTLLMAFVSLFLIGKVCLFCALLYLMGLFLFGLLFALGKADGSFTIRILDGIKSIFNVFSSRASRLWTLSSIGFIFMLVCFKPIYVDQVLRPRYLKFFDHNVVLGLVNTWSAGKVFFERKEAEDLDAAIVLGESNAKIQIVELSDFECPFCQKVAPVLKDFYEKYKNKVQLVLINFPLDEACNPAIKRKMHERSCDFSRLAILQTKRDMKLGFDLHEKIMSENPSSEFEISELNKVVGNPTDEEKIKTESALKAHIDFGIKHGVEGTPAIFVNGKRIPYNNFFQIEAVLEQIVLSLN